jgi:hypothetical protein
VNRDREGLEIKERLGGFWAKVPFFSPPPDPEQGREVGAASADGGRRHPRGQRWPGIGEKGEGTEGISTPCSPWAGVACGGGSAARSVRRRRLAATAQLVVVLEQGRVVGARW